MDDPIWDADERAAWLPPSNLLPSDWAEAYRYLSRRQSPRQPGPWRNDNQPALRWVMDLAVRATIRELWVKKSPQIGVSEAIRNVIGCQAHQSPDPALLVLPDEKKGREIMRKRLLPLFEETEVLAGLLTGLRSDKKFGGVSLTNGFDLVLGYSGSPSSIASDPFGVVIADEVDKYERTPGGEGDVVELLKARTRTLQEMGKGRLIAPSTPTTPDGPVTLGYEACVIKLEIFVPCPHCGTHQVLRFDNLKWEKFTDLGEPERRAAAVETAGAAWFECVQCGGRIENRHKHEMLRHHYWGTADGSWKLWFDGREEGRQPDGFTVGMHLPAFYDLSVSFAKIAAVFILCDGRPEKLQSFYNDYLALDFKIAVSVTVTSTFARMCTADPETGFVPPPAKLVPVWASRLLMSVDTQKDHFYYVVRAWGHRMRSQRVAHGRVTSFEELAELFYGTAWHYPPTADPTIFQPLRIFRMGIDSGGTDDGQRDATRTDEVYTFCNRDPLHLLPMKGASKALEERIRWRFVTYTPPNAKRSPYEVRLWLWDGAFFRDLLSSHIAGRLQTIDPLTGEVTGDEPQWMLNDVNDDQYNRQMSNVVKSRVRKGKSHVEVWMPRTPGARHDYHDAEAEQLALAYGPGECQTLLTPEMIAKQRAAMQRPGSRPTGITTPDGRPFLASRR